MKLVEEWIIVNSFSSIPIDSLLCLFVGSIRAHFEGQHGAQHFSVQLNRIVYVLVLGDHVNSGIRYELTRYVDSSELMPSAYEIVIFSCDELSFFMCLHELSRDKAIFASSLS